jgi:hypothetical protein
MSDVIRIEVSLWDSGCLPELLRKEIAAVERYLRAIGDQLSASDLAGKSAYRDQLVNCARAVAKARA